MRQLLFILLSSLSLLTSCSRTAYVPSVQNVPMLTEKHDINGTITFNNIQSAYAISDHIGLTLSAETDGIFKNLTDEDESKKHVVEVGAGYFTPISEDLYFNIYSGAGLGKISFQENTFNEMGRFSSRKANYYIQPSISYQTRFVELAFSTRVTGVDFFDMNDSEYFVNTEATDPFDLRLINDPFYTFVEPAFTLRAGHENIKISLQIQHSLIINGDPITSKDRRFVMGVNFNFNTKKPHSLD